MLSVCRAKCVLSNRVYLVQGFSALAHVGSDNFALQGLHPLHCRMLPEHPASAWQSVVVLPFPILEKTPKHCQIRPGAKMATD
jgi:hypothetical protein